MRQIRETTSSKSSPSLSPEEKKQSIQNNSVFPAQQQDHQILNLKLLRILYPPPPDRGLARSNCGVVTGLICASSSSFVASLVPRPCRGTAYQGRVTVGALADCTNHHT